MGDTVPHYKPCACGHERAGCCDDGGECCTCGIPAGHGGGCLVIVLPDPAR